MSRQVTYIHEGKEICNEFRLEVHDGRDSLQNLGVYRKIIVKWVLKKEDEMTWSDRALERDKWRTLVNTVMILHCGELLVQLRKY